MAFQADKASACPAGQGETILLAEAAPLGLRYTGYRATRSIWREAMMQTVPLNQPPSNQAVTLFWRTSSRGWFFRLWARLTHHATRLLDLEETLCCNQVQNSAFAGVRAVCIDCIRGTLGKADAFDATFHPVKESSRSRWMGIAIEKLRGHELPPVDLIDVEGTYYVRDGHHRISVARSLGQVYIEAEITRMSLSRRGL